MPKQLALGCSEQVLAPLDGRPKRLMTVGHVAGTAREQRQAMLESRQQRVERQHIYPSGGELDRKRQTVQAAADGLNLLVLDERRIDRSGSFDEKRHGVGGTAGVNREALLSGDAQRLRAWLQPGVVWGRQDDQSQH